MNIQSEGEIHVSGAVQPFQIEQFAGCVAYGSPFQDAAAHSGITGTLAELSAFSMRPDVQLHVAIKLKERLGSDMDAVEAVVTARLWEMHLLAISNGDTTAAMKALDAWQKKQSTMLLKSNKTKQESPNTRGTIRDLWEELRNRARATGDTSTEAVAIANLDKIDGVSAEAAAEANTAALSKLASAATAITFTLTRPFAAEEPTPIERMDDVVSEQ